MFPLRAAALPLFPDPTLLWSQLMFPPRISLPEGTILPEAKTIPTTDTPRLTTIGHEQAPRQIGLNPVTEDANAGSETVAGLLLLDLRLTGRRFVSVICIKEQGFPVGSEIQIPEAWRQFCREEDAGNLCDTTVVRAIGVGEEIIFRPPDRKDPQGSFRKRAHRGSQYGHRVNRPLARHECHKDEFAEGTGFSCDRCGKVFSYSYYRDKHLKYTRCVDNGDRKFPCPICSRSFEKRDRLRIHVLHVHENHRPHCCAICGKAFSQSSSLNKHLRVHSGERPYACPFCPKAFTASSILRTHIRQHSGEKPFKCAHCGKAFASHAAHDSHVRRTHLKTS